MWALSKMDHVILSTVFCVIVILCGMRRVSCHAVDEEKVPRPGRVEEVTSGLHSHYEGESYDSLSADLVDTLNKTLQNYDNEVRPGFFGPPTRVAVSMDIQGILHVSEVDMELKIDFYLYQEWTDARLKFTHPNISNNSAFKYAPLSYELSQKIWIPDTYFYNEKDSLVHSATVPNGFFRWYPDGHVLQSIRMTLTSTCPMDLRSFPMDTQICTIIIGSYGLSEAHLVYLWESDSALNFAPQSLKLLQNIQLAGYRQRKELVEYPESNYTTLRCDFLLSRSLSYYLILVYFPSALIVIISWFAFWIQREASAERMALGVTSVLTITTLLLSTQASSPKISYVKAIDVYVGVCFGMVFISLLHSALIGYLLRRASLRNQRNSTDVVTRNENSEYENPPAAESAGKHSSALGQQGDDSKPFLVKSITRCDIASRIMFPVGFTAFNLIYWFYYLNAHDGVSSSNWITTVLSENKTVDIKTLH